MVEEKKLGRGLSSLIGERYSSFEEDYDQSKVSELELSKITPGKYQPRQEFDPLKITELAESIKQNGIIQPIIVRKCDDEIISGKESYEIIAGERRFKAAKQAGLNVVPVIVKDIDDKSALEIAIIENVQRQDLNVIEEATGYKRLIDEFGYIQEQVAEIIGKSRSHIANMLRLLNLSPGVKDHLMNSRLTAGHARLLLTVQNPQELAQQIIDGNLSVRDAETLVKEAPQKRPVPPKKRDGANSYGIDDFIVKKQSSNKNDDIVAMEESLSSSIGMKVEISSKGERGKVIIDYKSLNDLDKIISLIEKNSF